MLGLVSRPLSSLDLGDVLTGFFASVIHNQTHKMHLILAEIFDSTFSNFMRVHRGCAENHQQ